jgi:hypothetical protein
MQKTMATLGVRHTVKCPPAAVFGDGGRFAKFDWDLGVE